MNAVPGNKCASLILTPISTEQYNGTVEFQNGAKYLINVIVNGSQVQYTFVSPIPKISNDANTALAVAASRGDKEVAELLNVMEVEEPEKVLGTVTVEDTAKSELVGTKDNRGSPALQKATHKTKQEADTEIKVNGNCNSEGAVRLDSIDNTSTSTENTSVSTSENIDRAYFSISWQDIGLAFRKYPVAFVLSSILAIGALALLIYLLLYPARYIKKKYDYNIFEGQNNILVGVGILVWPVGLLITIWATPDGEPIKFVWSSYLSCGLISLCLFIWLFIRNLIKSSVLCAIVAPFYQIVAWPFIVVFRINREFAEAAPVIIGFLFLASLFDKSDRRR
jgi:hypothetical protein